MRFFDDPPITLPPVQLKSLKDDPEGQALWERLDALETRRQEAEATLHRESQPLADLMAEADELAALALVGDADDEAAEEAEKNVQKARQRVEDARRAMNQCDRAETLVREKLRRRAAEVHAENTEAVRAVHRVLLHRALEAERRAATLLRVLREFEQRYARYGTDDESARHPQYLAEEDRTQPPRALMGPARASGGTVFDRSEAAAWMRRAADRLETDAPPLLDVTSLDFEAPDATPTYVDPEEGTDEAPPVSDPEPPAPSAEDAPRGPSDTSGASPATSDDTPDDAPDDTPDAAAESSGEKTPTDENPTDENPTDENPTDETESSSPASEDPASEDPASEDPASEDPRAGAPD
jgi:hypothetical protein